MHAGRMAACVSSAIAGTEFELDADLVLLAMGFVGAGARAGCSSALGVRLTERGTVWRDANWMTSVPGVFVAGDMQRGQSLIVWAIAEGRSAARGVDALSDGRIRAPGATVLAGPHPMTLRYDFSRIIGSSGRMRQVCEQITQVARARTTVLLRGESGTGKELIAHAIYESSPRAAKPFIKVSCAALPDTLIESELFGFEKGAFSGAFARKPGRFDLAEGGTLFLDEIGEVSLATQVKLLRVLQEREFDRLGGTAPVKVNVRLIVATNKDLEKAIAAGTFREDLHYRLNVFTIFLPPLRERKPDILQLADYFLEKYSIEHDRAIKRLSTPAIDMLAAYHWPGNVRELANVIERAVIVCDCSVIHGHHLPPTLQTPEATGTVPDVSLEASVRAYEKDLITDALKTTRGNQAKAAKLLRSTERIINYKVQKYGIDCERFRS